jgi:hypothetical protein
MFDKKQVLLLFILITFYRVRAQGGHPILKFDVDTANFGIVQEGDTVRYDFYFTNTGSADLIIRQAWPACGCTHPTFTKDTIKPGGRGFIHVEFLSQGWGGQEVHKEVIIISNAPENYARFKARIIKKSDVKRKTGSGATSSTANPEGQAKKAPVTKVPVKKAPVKKKVVKAKSPLGSAAELFIFIFMFLILSPPEFFIGKRPLVPEEYRCYNACYSP